MASGDEKQGLTAAVFSDGVEYRESGGTPAVQRLVRSRNLDAALKNGFAEISDARFTGNVQFSDGRMQASAGDVRYKVARGQRGHHRQARKRAAARGQRSDHRGRRSYRDGARWPEDDRHRRTGPHRAEGGEAGRDKDAAKMPGLMQQDRDVNGSSDKLVYDGANGSTAEFTGNARLFQGETLVQGQKVS